MVSGMEITKNGQLSQPFKSVGELRSTMQLVHSDVCGPMQTESIGVFRDDDYSRCFAVYFMRNKSEVLEKFKEFEASATNESSQRIGGTLRTDNGGEYVAHEFKAYLKSKGMNLSSLYRTHLSKMELLKE